MAERSKALAWRASVRESVPWVRIPVPPPVVLKSGCQSFFILRYISKPESDKMEEPRRDSNYESETKNHFL